MSQFGDSENCFEGRYMIQDQDHMAAIVKKSQNKQDFGARQVDQSQSARPQLGGTDAFSDRQQGSGERRSHQ